MREIEATADDGLSMDEIEAAYAHALEAIEAVEDSCDNTECDSAEIATANPLTVVDPPHEIGLRESDPDSDAVGNPGEPLIQPRQIIEAALFVGGEPLTIRRLSQLIGEHSGPQQVEDLVEGLNRQYADEARPYEIIFGEGGYRLGLRSEFETIRDRVYGAGPRDVKLSQECLEALAIIAYRQPVTRDALVEAGKGQATSLIQQLLRRELIALQRDDTQVTYVTTARFLDLFGLRSLNELPVPADLEFK